MTREQIAAKLRERFAEADAFHAAFPDKTGIREAFARSITPEQIADFVVALPADLQAEFARDWLTDPPATAPQ
jgi:hypothetical protein